MTNDTQFGYLTLSDVSPALRPIPPLEVPEFPPIAKVQMALRPFSPSINSDAMKNHHILAFALVATLGLSALLTSRPPVDEKIGLDAVKDLVGTWVAVDENGQPTDQVMSVIRPTAGGSVLIETMFPGSEHEMITMYYTREGHLMMTHYCGCTNHPILKASRGENGLLRFDCIGTGENFAHCASVPHMHDAEFQLTSTTLKSKWRMLDKGEFNHVGEFDMIKVKEKPRVEAPAQAKN